MSDATECPQCEGRGYELMLRGDGLVYKVMCVVCSGTRKRPVERSVAVARRAARARNVQRK